MTLTTTVVFAAGAGDSDEAAADDCGVASNCGGLGGWRVILLATEPRSGEEASDSEPVEDPVEPVGNQAPNRVGSIRDQALTVGGESATVDVASFFSDPDGDDLTYRASSSNDRIATATVSGSDVTVAPAAEGTATIMVTASDPGGLTAEQTFAATVSDDGGGAEDSYCRDGQRVDNGTQCEIYDTDAVLEIDADGRFCTRNVPGVGDGCVTDRVGGRWRIDAREGIRIYATRTTASFWTIDDVEPEPDD